MKTLKTYLIVLHLIICLDLLRKTKFVSTQLFSLNNSVADRHLYVDFENYERDKVNITCHFVCSVLSEDNNNNPEVAQEIDGNRVVLKDNRR